MKKFDITVRTLYPYGSSVAFSIPPSWGRLLPPLLYVYSNDVYAVYAGILGLDDDLNVSYLGRVRKRPYKKRDGHEYYQLVVPKLLREKLGIGVGSRLLLVLNRVMESYMLVVYSDIEYIIKVINNAIMGNKRGGEV